VSEYWTTNGGVDRKPIFESNLLPREYAELAFAQIMQVFAASRLVIRYKVLAKDGTATIAQISAAPIRKQGSGGLIAISRDITARKKVEEGASRSPC